MIYTPLTKKALRLSFEAHRGQYDKGGLPYVNHPLHVAEQMHTEFETCAALLHDVMEDSGFTEADLRAADMPDAVMEALALLTHERGTPYLDYIRTLKTNQIARAVKIADLEHNSDLTRLDAATARDLERVAKYAEALAILRAQ